MWAVLVLLLPIPKQSDSSGWTDGGLAWSQLRPLGALPGRGAETGPKTSAAVTWDMKLIWGKKKTAITTWFVCLLYSSAVSCGHGSLGPSLAMSLCLGACTQHAGHRMCHVSQQHMVGVTSCLWATAFCYVNRQGTGEGGGEAAGDHCPGTESPSWDWQG